MSSRDVRQDPDCAPTDVCYRAVTTAYRRLRECGATEEVSFKSAVSVFRHHHPEVPATRACYLVADWLD